MKASEIACFMLAVGFWVTEISVVVGQNMPLVKEPYRLVQIITEGLDYYDDGGNYTLFPEYSVSSTDGDAILIVPENINKPHTILIIPGEYFISLSLKDEIKKFHIQVDEDCFQQIRLSE